MAIVEAKPFSVYAVYWTSMQIDTVRSLWFVEQDAIDEADRLRAIGMKAFVRPMKVQ